MQSQDIVFVPVDELQVGMYVHLDLKWFEHPFAFNHFKIKDTEQIAVIRSLGVGKVRYDPTRSDRRPSEAVADAVAPAAEPPSADEVELAVGHLEGRMLLSLESTTVRSNRLGASLVTGVPIESLERTVERIRAVTRDDLHALARELFAPARLSLAVVAAMGAEGSFVAMNNTVSQSVPHLHVHVVPRRVKDGLKGFFWPRVPYRDADHERDVQERLRAALAAD